MLPHGFQASESPPHQAHSGERAGYLLRQVLPYFFGVVAQTWDVNSLSRCNSKLRSISAKDVPVGVPEGLNRQPHSEQPKPRKRSPSIHTIFRLTAASVAASQ
jgi:hypothetical protein